jgi:pimeloyl-ACP methyl ester carboxylesterase
MKYIFRFVLLLLSLSTLRAEAKMESAHLLTELPGFKSGFANVNGIRLHYVEGGNGAPLILLPGWLQTWWEYHQVMPALAKHFHVIVVDIRGMGDSDRPAGGYDKKTMAQDVSELVKSLGFEKVNIAGHDIGGQVVFSFVANHPDQSIRAAMMDVVHPDDSFYKIPMLLEEGKFGEKVDDRHPKFAWWIAFNQVRGLPEQALEGRFHFVQDWVFDYALKDKKSISVKDRAVFKEAYKSREAIRASNAWYQAWPRDILDARAYGKIQVPLLALGATGYDGMKSSLSAKVENLHLVRVEDSGHFVVEEQPEFVTTQLLEFFK